MFSFLTVLACAVAPGSPDTATASDQAPASGPGVVSTPEHPVVIGAISARDVESVLSGYMDAIQRCYEDERVSAPGLAGKVLVKFTIDEDGAVSKTATKSTSLRHPPTEDCLNQIISGAVFRPPGGGSAYVSYAFFFSAGR